jgi:hypothetical protein
MRALRCEMLPFVGLTEDEAHCTIGVVTTNDIDMDGDEVDHVDRSHGTMLIVDTGSSEGTTAVHVCQPSWKLVPPRIPQRMLCFLLWPLLHTRSRVQVSMQSSLGHVALTSVPLNLTGAWAASAAFVLGGTAVVRGLPEP